MKSKLFPILLGIVFIITIFGCTKQNNNVPTVLISTVTDVETSAILSKGEISDDGGVPVTVRGICWSTSQNPTVLDNKTTDGSGVGSFTSLVSGLAPGATYYLRAYAINEYGIGYSTQVKIAISATIPVLTTSELSSVTVSSASGGGEITSDGGADITVRGVCWSKNPDPTIADAKTADGSGLGKFLSTISGLTPGTVYYLRAYATNSAGTAYGNQVSIITVSDVPVISDGAVVTLQKATIGRGIDIVFVGDGYSVQDISAKKYENNIKQAVTHFFNIEPYRSYSSYFNVYMVYAFSEESGISDLEKTVKTKFETKYTATSGTSMSTNSNTCLNYVRKAPIIDIRNTVAVLIANSTRYGGTTYMNSGGLNIAICPMPQYYFSYILQHEAGGHAFGTLADEYVNKTGTIPQDQIDALRRQQSYGIFLNVDITSNKDQTVWKHFNGLPKYSYVSTYEGGYLYPQGVWRPEANSIMVNNVRYFNAPGREIIVKRIMKLAGMTYSFENFQAKDVMELTTRSAGILDKSMQLPSPVIIN